MAKVALKVPSSTLSPRQHQPADPQTNPNDSETPAPIISSEQFATIEEICYQSVQVISKAEDRLMIALAILSFVPLSLLAVGRVIVLGVRKHHAQSKIYAEMLIALKRGDAGRRLRMGLVLTMGLIPLVACGLLWTVVRVQQFQKQMAEATGSGFADGQWTFGQVVAVTVFVPVLVECWALFRERQD